MSAQNAKISAAMESSEWDLVMTRVFDAPRELVFKAWTETKHVAQWWGPKSFTNPVCEMDVRPGGAIRIHMRAPDGVVYPMTGVFQEIVVPERLVFVGSALDDKGNSMFDVLNTVIFADQRGKTALTLQLRVIKATAAAPQYLKGMEMGWTQSLDRLAALLGSIRGRREPAERVGAVMTTRNSGGEAEIRQLVEDQQSAVCAKDIDAIMAYYADEFAVFNVKPPFQILDAREWRRVWEMSLAHFPASFGSEMRDLVVSVSGELAVAHYFLRFTGLPGEPSWIRVTAVYRRIAGRWLIVHEHSSVPIDPDALRPVFALE